MEQANGLTMHIRFEGWWCDNCRRVWNIKGFGVCLDCGPRAPLLPATITVDVHRDRES